MNAKLLAALKVGLKATFPLLKKAIVVFAVSVAGAMGLNWLSPELVQNALALLGLQ